MIRQRLMLKMNEVYKNDGVKIINLFYILAAVQILQIIGGVVFGLFVAPASLFVSRTETEAFGWFVLAFISLAYVVLGVILIPLSIIAAVACRRDRKWQKIIGISAACLAILELPFGTILAGFIGWKLLKKPALVD